MRPTTSRGRSGVAAIEFALLAPLLLIMATGMVDLGIAHYEAMQVQIAAEAGAQYARAHGFNAAAITAAVTAAATSTAPVTAAPAPIQYCGCPQPNGITSATCGGSCSDAKPVGIYVQVNAQAAHRTILPYPGLPSPLILTGQAVVRIN